MTGRLLQPRLGNGLALRGSTLLSGIAGSALLLLPSCSGCSDDPTQAGFFCGVRNIASGTYERRQAELSHEAALTESYASSQQAHIRGLHKEETALTAEQARLQGSLAALQRDTKREQMLIVQARS